jgi:hypothetical protein
MRNERLLQARAMLRDMKVVRKRQRMIVLKQREAIIIERRALGHTLRRIGDDMGLSADRVRLIEWEFLNRQAWLAQAVPNEQMTADTLFLDLADRGPVRVFNCVRCIMGDAVTVGQLRRMPDSEFKKQPNFGKACLAQLRAIVGYAPGN